MHIYNQRNHFAISILMLNMTCERRVSVALMF